MIDVVYFDEYIYVTKENKINRKTPIYLVYSNKASVCIAVIKWFAQWRKFCFFPEGVGTIWDNKCLKSIVDLLDKFNDEWRHKM